MTRRARLWLAGLCLAAGLVTWNAVFDSRVTSGTREYVERQQLFAEGRGPRVDMDAVMRAAVSSGLRAATLWSMLPLVPAVVLVISGRRKKPR